MLDLGVLVDDLGDFVELFFTASESDLDENRLHDLDFLCKDFCNFATSGLLFFYFFLFFLIFI